MTAKELLQECKIKLGISSDYALAKALKIPNQRINDYMRDLRKPDTYALMKIAETLGREPLALISEFEATHEKDPIKKEFWEGFSQRANSLGRRFILGLICTLSLLAGMPGDDPGRVGFFRRRVGA